MRRFDLSGHAPPFRDHTIAEFLPFFGFLGFIIVNQTASKIILNVFFPISLLTAQLSRNLHSIKHGFCISAFDGLANICYDHGLVTRGRRNDVDLIWPRSMLEQ